MSISNSQAILSILNLVFKHSPKALDHYLTHEWKVYLDPRPVTYSLHLICKVCSCKAGIDLSYNYSELAMHPPTCNDYIIRDIIE